MKRVLLVIGLLACIAALFWWAPWRSGEPSANLLYGNVDVREVQLAFRVGGRLDTLLVEEGDQVSAGQPLATLDSVPAEQALSVSQAGVAEAEARLAGLVAGARPQEIAQAKAHVREATAAFANAQNEAQRQQQLWQSKSISRTILDSANLAHDRASAQLDSTREALALAEAGARSEDVTALEAAVAAARARAAQAQTALADTTLTASAAGVVLTRAREAGSLVSSGQTIYAIALTDRVFVRAYIDEPRLDKVAPGTSVTISTDSGDRTYTGQIGFVSPTAEFTPKSVETPELRTDLVYRLRIIVTDADDRLRQGMPVTVQLPDDEA